LHCSNFFDLTLLTVTFSLGALPSDKLIPGRWALTILLLTHHTCKLGTIILRSGGAGEEHKLLLINVDTA
jgi:hypothetical protein